MRMRPEQRLDIAAENTDQATMAINRDRDAGGAIALSTLAIAQALIAIGEIFSELKEQRKENAEDEPSFDDWTKRERRGEV